MRYTKNQIRLSAWKTTTYYQSTFKKWRAEAKGKKPLRTTNLVHGPRADQEQRKSSQLMTPLVFLLSSVHRALPAPGDPSPSDHYPNCLPDLSQLCSTLCHFRSHPHLTFTSLSHICWWSSAADVVHLISLISVCSTSPISQAEGSLGIGKLTVIYFFFSTCQDWLLYWFCPLSTG